MITQLSGARLLAELHLPFRSRGIAVRLAEAHGEVRDALWRMEFGREHVTLATGQTVDVVIATWQNNAAMVASPPERTGDR